MAALRELVWKIGPLSTGHQGARAQCAKQDRCVQFAQTLVRELKTHAAPRRYTIKRLCFKAEKVCQHPF